MFLTFLQNHFQAFDDEKIKLRIVKSRKKYEDYYMLIFLLSNFRKLSAHFVLNVQRPQEKPELNKEE